tara:strand:+ start:428 stop:862 length:435 start_codon:yes stop_codon:yes gene_type:complete
MTNPNPEPTVVEPTKPVEVLTETVTPTEPSLPSDDGFLDEVPVGNTQQQENSGALYPNLSRKKESHPNCRGRSFVGGKWYWVSGWNNLMPNNTRYVALAYTELTPEDVAKYITKSPTTKAAPTTSPATDALGQPLDGSKPDEIF